MTASQIASRRRRTPWLVAAWLILVVAGHGVAWRYESRAGTPASPPPFAAPNPEKLPSLLVFAHPQCPCTRATLEQLDHIAARVGDRARIQVCVFSDPDEPEAWTHSGTWDRAARIPGVTVMADVRGEKARALGVATSGETLLFAGDGRTLYHGGITSARGHAGDNAGADTVVEAVLGRRVSVESLPVFGCSLFESTSPAGTAP